MRRLTTGIFFIRPRAMNGSMFQPGDIRTVTHSHLPMKPWNTGKAAGSFLLAPCSTSGNPAALQGSHATATDCAGWQLKPASHNILALSLADAVQSCTIPARVGEARYRARDLVGRWMFRPRSCQHKNQTLHHQPLCFFRRRSSSVRGNR